MLIKRKNLIKLSEEFLIESKKNFKLHYQTMYLNPEKLSISEHYTLNRIIRLVDAQLLYEWLNEIVPNIFAVQKHLVLIMNYYRKKLQAFLVE